MFLTCFDSTTILQNLKPRIEMTTLSRFSRQNEAGLRALTVVREGTFFTGGGGGPGLLRGGSLVNILQIWEGETCLIRSRGRVTVFFGKENITPCRLVDFYFYNKHAKCLKT